MRIPLFERIRFKHAVLFAVGFFIVQQLERTEIAFSGLCVAYILLSCLAFNAAGGLVYPSGAWIFGTAILVVLFGIILKALLGEPGQTNLKEPTISMAVECAAMGCYGLAAVVARKLLPSTGLLAGWSLSESMKKAAIGALAIGFLITMVEFLSPGGGTADQGSIISGLRQLNHFNQMAILLATYYEVRYSNGRKSTNWVVWCAFAVGSFSGFLNFSKEGILISWVTWFITAVVAGHDFTRKQLALVLGFALLFNMYLVPYSQTARGDRDENATFAVDLKVAWTYLSDLGKTRSLYKEEQANQEMENVNFIQYYNTGQGFLDRLSMLPPDDGLIAYTDEGHTEGLEPTLSGFYNLVPHVLWKEKPFYFFGNAYAREMGWISEANDATGISFSPASDAYHQEKWLGVFLILPVILFINFYVTNGLSGDIRKTPWGILFVVVGAHGGPEGMVNSQIYEASYVAFGIVVVASLARYVLPIVTGVITNSDRTRVRRTMAFRPANSARPQPPSLPAEPAQNIL